MAHFCSFMRHLRRLPDFMSRAVRNLPLDVLVLYFFFVAVMMFVLLMRVGLLFLFIIVIIFVMVFSEGVARRVS